MIARLERVLLDPISEDATNAPLELTAFDAGSGIDLLEHSYPAGDRKTVYAGNIDSRGERRAGGQNSANRRIPVKVWVYEEEGIVAATNLLTNPSFEKGLTDWGNLGAAAVNDYSRSTAWAKASEASLHYKATALASSVSSYVGSKDLLTVANNYPAVAGRTYFARAHLNVLSRPAAGLGVYVFFWNSGGTLLSSLAAATTASLGEQILSGTVTAPANSAYMAVVVGNIGTMANGEVMEFYVDDVMLVDQTAAGATITADYFDGDTPGCSWTGTAHASTSTRLGIAGKRFTGALSDLEKKIEKLNREGGTFKRILSSGDTITFDVLDASIQGTTDKLTNQFKTAIDLEFVCRPYGRGPEQAATLTTTDDFTTDTIASGRWRFDTGSGTITGSTGQLAPSSTAEKKLYRQHRLGDVTVRAKWTAAGTLGSPVVGLIAKRLDASNYMLGTINVASGRIEIYKFDGAAYTLLQSSLGWTPTAGATYWLELVASGNQITFNVYASDPTGATTAPTPLVTTTTGLAGGNATKFGTGVTGHVGIRWIPGNTGERIDDFRTVGDGAWSVTGPLVKPVISSIKGSVPALGRMVLTEEAGFDKAWIAWGVQSRYYDWAPTADLHYFASTLTPLGGSSVFGGIVSGTLTTSWLSILSTQIANGGAQLSHVGSYRVVAHVFDGTGDHQLAFSWAVGDGRRAFQNTEVSTTKGYQFADLGTITIPKAASGAQQWFGRMLARRKSGTSSSQMIVDWIAFLPVDEGAGDVQIPASFPAPDAFEGYDDFVQTAGNLATKVAPSGGTWTAATSAGGVDLATTGSQVQRSTSTADTTPRVDYLSALTARTTVAAQLDLISGFTGMLNPGKGGIALRITDANNFVGLRLNADFQNGPTLELFKRVAGVETSLGTYVVKKANTFTPTIRFLITASGRYYAWIFTQGGSQGQPVISGLDSSLATGGTLASGFVGIYDSAATGASTRVYDNFASWVPVVDAAMLANRSTEIRWDGVRRQDSGGTLYQPLTPTGDLLALPVGQRSGIRQTRLGVLTSRALPLAGDSPADEFTARVLYTPLYDNVPEPT